MRWLLSEVQAAAAFWCSLRREEAAGAEAQRPDAGDLHTLTRGQQWLGLDLWTLLSAPLP